jgi:hypothetical protein
LNNYLEMLFSFFLQSLERCFIIIFHNVVECKTDFPIIKLEVLNPYHRDFKQPSQRNLQKLYNRKKPFV